jgi:hypothetical protein
MSRVVKAENDVVARFDELVRYYVDMGPTYITPVMGHSDLAEGDRARLAELQQSLQTLSAMPSRDEQFEELRIVQKKMLGFFATTILPESMSADPQYQQWSKNATNFGEASTLLKNYNDALGLYNALSKSSAGKLVTAWRSWNHHQYLSVSGELEETPQVSF